MPELHAGQHTHRGRPLPARGGGGKARRRRRRPLPRTWPHSPPRARRRRASRDSRAPRADHSAGFFVWPNSRNGPLPAPPLKTKKITPSRPLLPSGVGSDRRAGGGSADARPGRKGPRPPGGRSGRDAGRRTHSHTMCPSARTRGTFRWGFWAPTRRGIFGKQRPVQLKRCVCVAGPRPLGRVRSASGPAPLPPLPRRRRSQSFSRSVRVCVGPCYHRMWKLISSLVKNNSTSPGTQIIPAISCLLH